MPSVPPPPAAVAHRSRWLALVAALALLLPVLPALQPAPAAAEVTDEQLAAGGVLRDSQDHRIAPGLDLTTFSRLEEGGWKEGSVLTADLNESTCPSTSPTTAR
jgi:hypothetical protein